MLIIPLGTSSSTLTSHYPPYFLTLPILLFPFKTKAFYLSSLEILSLTNCLTLPAVGGIANWYEYCMGINGSGRGNRIDHWGKDRVREY